MDVCSVIEEAKSCSAALTKKYADAKVFGNHNDKLFYDLLMINTFIRTLERNQVKRKMIKKPILTDGSHVDFSALKRRNNVLILEAKEEFICEEVEISPCLSDPEICHILEQVKVLCSEYSNC